MWKHFTRKEYVNDKLIYRKPFSKYCIVLLLAINLTVLLLFAAYSMSYYALFVLSPYYKEKIQSKYSNTVMKNSSISTEYRNGSFVSTANGSSITYDNETTIAYDKGMFSKNYNFKRAVRHADGYEGFSGFTCFMFFLNVLIVCSYKLISWVKKKLIKRYSELDMCKSATITRRRKEYLNDKILHITAETDAHIARILSEESVVIFSHLNISHPNVMKRTLLRREIHYNLKKFMFYETWEEMPGNMPPFIDIVAYMRDILNGTQYLHDSHIYHLNIAPENILIVADVENPLGIAKIANFHHAIFDDKHIIENQKVGLDWIYR